MSLIAAFRVSDPELPLAETLGAIDALDIEVHFQPGRPNQTPAVLATVQCADDDAFEAHLESDPSVRSFQTHVSTAGGRMYRIRFQDDVQLLGPTLVGHGLQIEALESDGAGWAFQVVAPDRETLGDALEDCRGACGSFSLTELYTRTAVTEGDHGLTEAQRETLELAYRTGFFDVPRQTDQAELAETLGVSTSAVSQRLRKAVHGLIDATLDLEE